MIMTVMGITLGIIFFILNPNLNTGIKDYPGEIFSVNKNTLIRVSDKLKEKTDCDYLMEDTYCEIILDADKKLEISTSESSIPFKYDVTFRLIKGNKTIKISKQVQNTIEQVGLLFLMNMDTQ